MSIFRHDAPPSAPASNVPYLLEWEFPDKQTKLTIRLRLLRELEAEAHTAPEGTVGLLVGLAPEDGMAAKIALEGCERIAAQSVADDPGGRVERLGRGIAERQSAPAAGSSPLGFYIVSREMTAASVAAEFSALKTRFADETALVLVIRNSEESAATLYGWDAARPNPFRLIRFPLDAASLREQDYKPFVPYYFGMSRTGGPAPAHAPPAYAGVPPDVQAPRNGPPVTRAEGRPPFYSVPQPQPRDTEHWDAEPPLSAEPALLTRSPHLPIVGLVGAIALAAGFFGWWVSRPDKADSAAPTAIAYDTVSEDRSGLELQVARKGGDLQIRWSRSAPSILSARFGLLNITDGDRSTNMPLDEKQLKTTQVLYTPRSPRIELTLEVVTAPANKVVQESLLVVQAAAGAPASQVFVAPIRRPPLLSSTADRQSEAPPAAAESVQPRAAVAFVPPAPATSQRENAGAMRIENVAPEPVGASEFAKLPNAISDIAPAPLASSLAPPPPSAPPPEIRPSQPPPNPRAQLSPAVPVRQVQVAVPDVLKKMIRTETVIEVTVSVDEAGKVTSASAASATGWRHYLTEAAKAAARDWRFAPAREGAKPVNSDVVLRFKFGPGMPGNR